ncbi:Ribonuclease G/E [Bradyrhizobium sp. F1.4.3]|uniref:hypothetical protein n=1 Tax=Bradyrhizobium sp. F1.4.3 TaxID=3156356 RepID=UPI0033936650
MLHHIAHRAKAQAESMTSWLDLRAPWLCGEQRQALIAKVMANPIRYKADTLARKIGLTAERRAHLRITTIGATDETAEQRKAKRRAKDIERKREKRFAAGCKPRSAASMPWVAEGISRATYFRRQKEKEQEEAQTRETRTAAA